MRTFLFLILVSFSVTAAPLPELETDCASSQQPIPWSYCIIRTKGSCSRDVLYYFHGRNLDEKAWLDPTYYPAQLRKNWAERGVDAPTVVAVSFGKVWLLVEKNQSPASGLFELTAGMLLPQLEKKLGPVHRRLLLGESMGGFNATQLALKTDKIFRRAALLRPPMAALSPFSTEEEIKAFIARTGAEEAKVRDIVALSHYFMPTPDDWTKGNPLSLVDGISKETPRLYVSCGSYDQYGFFEGAEKFASVAMAKGRTQWRPLYGGHCAVDIDSVARFLVP